MDSMVERGKPSDLNSGSSNASSECSLAAGQVRWHCSGEDEGPDVAIMMGLGSGRSLWIGELLDGEYCGPGFAVWTETEKLAWAPMDEWEEVRDLFEHYVAPALAGGAAAKQREPKGHHHDAGNMIEKVARSMLPSLGYPEDAKWEAIWLGNVTDSPEIGSLKALCMSAARAAINAIMEPTVDQWDGLARQIIMWMDMKPKTPRALFQHLERSGHVVPQWLRDEPEMQSLDHVPSKGTRAVMVYRAMLSAALSDTEGR